MTEISLLMLLIIGCQWVAWRFNWPAIVLLSISGIVLGPVTGILDPEAILKDYYPVLVSLAVAVILFDGGLSLRFAELEKARKAVQQLIWIGAPLGWVLYTLTAHYIAGFSWPVASVLGGLLIVTGPTVIIPLLRQARMHPRIASVLKWEGIVNDPVGVIIAFFAFEWFLATQSEEGVSFLIILQLLVSVTLIVALTIVYGRALVIGFRQGMMPDYLKPPAVLASVFLVYVLADLITHEGGLLAVTVLGMVIANSNLPSYGEIRHFKETISLLLVSLIFIFITATLEASTFDALDFSSILFLILILLVIRPLIVLISTFRTAMTWKEKLFACWIAPRGVVLAVTSGFMAQVMMNAGVEDANVLVPMAFAVIFSTVLLHGFTMRPLGMRLGLVAAKPSGLLIVGCNAWTVELAKMLASKDINVLIADENWYRLRRARSEGIPFYYGDVLVDEVEVDIGLYTFSHLLAVTENDAYNSLLCARFAHELGRSNVFQVATEKSEVKEKSNGSPMQGLGGRHFLDGLLRDEIEEKLREDWRFRSVRLTEEFRLADYRARHHEKVIPVLWVDDNHKMQMFSKKDEASGIKEGLFISLALPVETKDATLPVEKKDPAPPSDREGATFAQPSE